MFPKNNKQRPFVHVRPTKIIVCPIFDKKLSAKFDMGAGRDLRLPIFSWLVRVIGHFLQITLSVQNIETRRSERKLLRSKIIPEISFVSIVIRF